MRRPRPTGASREEEEKKKVHIVNVHEK